MAAAAMVIPRGFPPDAGQRGGPTFSRLPQPGAWDNVDKAPMQRKTYEHSTGVACGAGVCRRAGLRARACAERRWRQRHSDRAICRAKRSGGGTGQTDAGGHSGAFQGGECGRWHPRPHAPAGVARRRLRTRTRAGQCQGPDCRRQGVCADRLGGHTHDAGGAAGHHSRADSHVRATRRHAPRFAPPTTATCSMCAPATRPRPSASSST